LDAASEFDQIIHNCGDEEDEYSDEDTQVVQGNETHGEMQEKCKK